MFATHSRLTVPGVKARAIRFGGGWTRCGRRCPDTPNSAMSRVKPRAYVVGQISATTSCTSSSCTNG